MALTDNLISVWHKNEGSGTTAADSIGTNHGTLYGATWDSVNKKLGASCLTLDGIDDDVVIANESNFDFERTQAFSVHGWFKYANTTAASMTLISKQDVAGAGYRGWDIHTDVTTNGLRVELISTYPSNYISVLAGSGLNDALWHHFLVTYSGSSTAAGVKIYLDGVLQTNTVEANTLSATILNNIDVKLGSRFSIQYWKGLRDEQAVWNRELTSTENTELWNGGTGIEVVAGGQPLNLRGTFIPGMRQWQPNMLRR